MKRSPAFTILLLVAGITLTSLFEMGGTQIHLQLLKIVYAASQLSVSVGATASVVDPGGNITTTATVTGGQAPYQYQWFNNGKESSVRGNHVNWTSLRAEGPRLFRVVVTDASGSTASGQTEVVVRRAGTAARQPGETSGHSDHPLPIGKGRLECPTENEPITLFTYKPQGYKDGPLLIVFHGVGHNAKGYRDCAMTIADGLGMIVVAPLFEPKRFPGKRYQDGGIIDDFGKQQPRDTWTYSLIPKIVKYVCEVEGKQALPYYLIGHSAGGQFLVRLAAFMPGKAVRIVAANPGSELFPTRDQKFRYGFGGLPHNLSNDNILRAYLAAPLTLYLGRDDIYPRPSFDGSRSAMKQGPNRLERGRACFEFGKKTAKEHGWAFNWQKVETPGIGHDPAKMFAAKEVRDALLGNK